MNPILLLASTFLAVLPMQSPATKAPKLVLSADAIDLGTLFDGELGNGKFVVENQGDADLAIMRVQPSCGCTLARILREDTGEEVVVDKTKPIGIEPVLVLSPGKKAVIELTYNSSGQPQRRIVKHIDVFSNDPTEERKRVTLIVTNRKAYRLQPNPIQFGDVRAQSAKTVQLEVTPEPGVTFSITGAPAVEGIETKLGERTTEDGRKSFTIDVTLMAGVPVGAFTRTLVLTTDHATLTSLKVPMFGQILPLVDIDTHNQFNSKLLDFGVIDPSTAHTLGIDIVNADPAHPLTVADVQLQSQQADHLSTALVTLEAGQRYRLDVTTKAGMTGKFFKATLVVITEGSSRDSTTLYVSGWNQR